MLKVKVHKYMRIMVYIKLENVMPYLLHFLGMELGLKD
jgi:hypothetical protein